MFFSNSTWKQTRIPYIRFFAQTVDFDFIAVVETTLTRAQEYVQMMLQLSKVTMIYKNCRRRLGPKAARRHVLSELPPANCANSVYIFKISGCRRLSWGRDRPVTRCTQKNRPCILRSRFFEKIGRRNRRLHSKNVKTIKTPLFNCVQNLGEHLAIVFFSSRKSNGVPSTS